MLHGWRLLLSMVMMQLNSSHHKENVAPAPAITRPGGENEGDQQFHDVRFSFVHSTRGIQDNMIFSDHMKFCKLLCQGRACCQEPSALPWGDASSADSARVSAWLCPAAQ